MTTLDDPDSDVRTSDEVGTVDQLCNKSAVIPEVKNPPNLPFVLCPVPLAGQVMDNFMEDQEMEDAWE